MSQLFYGIYNNKHYLFTNIYLNEGFGAVQMRGLVLAVEMTERTSLVFIPKRHIETYTRPVTCWGWSLVHFKTVDLHKFLLINRLCNIQRKPLIAMLL